MTMNLMGVPTNLPLYDQEGNLISEPSLESDLMVISDEFQTEERKSTEEERQESEKLLNIVRDELLKVDDVGADLTVSDLVNVYDYNEDAEYYTVTIFGGKNGSGIWSNYLKVMSDLVFRLEAAFDDVWVRKWDVNVTDDIFEVEIAVVTFVG